MSWKPALVTQQDPDSENRPQNKLKQEQKVEKEESAAFPSPLWCSLVSAG